MTFKIIPGTTLGVENTSTYKTRPSESGVIVRSTSSFYSEPLTVKCVCLAPIPKTVPVTFYTNYVENTVPVRRSVGQAYFQETTATLNITTLSTGTNRIEAVWPGQGRYAGFSVESTSTVEVAPGLPYPGNMTLNSSNNPVSQASTTTLTVTASTGTNIGGVVTFIDRVNGTFTYPSQIVQSYTVLNWRGGVGYDNPWPTQNGYVSAQRIDLDTVYGLSVGDYFSLYFNTAQWPTELPLPLFGQTIYNYADSNNANPRIFPGAQYLPYLSPEDRIWFDSMGGSIQPPLVTDVIHDYEILFVEPNEKYIIVQQNGSAATNIFTVLEYLYSVVSDATWPTADAGYGFPDSFPSSIVNSGYNYESEPLPPDTNTFWKYTSSQMRAKRTALLSTVTKSKQVLAQALTATSKVTSGTITTSGYTYSLGSASFINGVATLNPSPTSYFYKNTGTHTISAEWSGGYVDSIWKAPVAINTLTQTVTTSSITLQVNSSFDPVVMTAIAGNGGYGYVEFYRAGTTLLGTVQVTNGASAQLSLAKSQFPSGSNTITAKWNGYLTSNSVTFTK